MSANICSWCKKTVKVFHSISYQNLSGLCSDRCEKDKMAREKALSEASKKSAFTDFTSAESHVPRRR